MESHSQIKDLSPVLRAIVVEWTPTSIQMYCLYCLFVPTGLFFFFIIGMYSQSNLTAKSTVCQQVAMDHCRSADSFVGLMLDSHLLNSDLKKKNPPVFNFFIFF